MFKVMKIATVALILASPANAQVVERLEHRAELCQTVSGFGATVALAYYQNISMIEMLKSVTDMENRASEDGEPSELDIALTAVLSRIIEDAYQLPNYSSESSQTRTIATFGKDSFQTCMRMLG